MARWKMKLHRRNLSHLLSAGLALAILGCGLGEYDARFSRTQERIQQFDADDALLGEPIHLPGAIDSIYLRLPREVSTQPLTQQSIHGLAHFPGQASTQTLPILEAHVGLVSVREVAAPNILMDRIVEDLQNYVGGVLEPLSEEPKDIEVARNWESPQLLEANRNLRYRKSTWLARHEALRHIQGQPLPLPAGFTGVFTYEIHIHSIEASEHVAQACHAVVIFRQLDEAQTRQRWEKLLASRNDTTDTTKPLDADQSSNKKVTPTEVEPAPQKHGPPESSGNTAPKPETVRQADYSRDLLRWLPQVDRERLHKAKRAALASLRVGEAARQRLQCYGR